jgi:steroid delta-isomerase-like uncharacterized protein
MSQSPEHLVRKWFDEIWNHRRLDAIDELMGEPCVIHDAGTYPGDIRRPAEFRAVAEGLHHAISGIHVEIEDVVADGAQVVIRCVVTGTHTGDGLGVPPTRRPVRITGMAWGRWREGKLVEAWNNFDLLSLFEQIGAIRRPS